MTAFHVCIQHCGNSDPTTEKTQLKTNNGINKVQLALHQYIAAQMLQFLQRERHEIMKTIQRGKMQV